MLKYFYSACALLNMLLTNVAFNHYYPLSKFRLSDKSKLQIRYKQSDDSDQNNENDEFDQFFNEEIRNNKSPKRFQPKHKPSLFNDLNKWEIVNRAVIAGVFVAGIGIGITLDSAISTNPKDLASRDAIDKNAPNPKLCMTYGSSAMVLDQRVFVTFNPFNIYVTQADTKPGCVLRNSNVVQQLQVERKLVSDVDMEACKNSFNTWGFIGDIDNKPQLNCLYQSDDAQNEFLSNPKVGLGEDVYDRSGNTFTPFNKKK